MYLIYQENPPRRYKRNPHIGGNAGGGGAYCSWASIKRVKIAHSEEQTDCQEIVCLFMGGQSANGNGIRPKFLRDLNKSQGSAHLFGISAPEE